MILYAYVTTVSQAVISQKFHIPCQTDIVAEILIIVMF